MSTPMGGRERDVRYRDGDFEMRCNMCDSWWPITLEFWRPKNGMQRCKACWAEYARLWMAAASRDEANRAAKNYKGRIAYWENREQRLAWNKAWKAANRERVKAYNAAYRAARKAA